jgi:hypothetical protein
MRGMLPAELAELREFQTARGRLLVLGGRVVPVLALRALQGNDLAHKCSPSLASHFDWQAAMSFTGRLTVLPTRRDAGRMAPATKILSFVPGSEAVRPRIALDYYPRNPLSGEGRKPRLLIENAIFCGSFLRAKCLEAKTKAASRSSPLLLIIASGIYAQSASFAIRAGVT